MHLKTVVELRITETTYEVSGNSYFNGSGKCKRAGSYEGGMKYICYDEDGMPIAEVTRYYDSVDIEF